MKISTLDTNLLTRLYRNGRPVLLRGGSGIAKTSIMNQWTSAVELGLVTFHATSIDAPDVRGFMFPQKTDAGPVSLFTKPPIITAIEQQIAAGFQKGVLFLDEFLQADHLVQKALRPLLTERMVGDHKLPDGWWVVLAGNRTSDKAGANRILGHVTNAVLFLEVEASVEGWLKWAKAEEIHPMCMAFASARPGVVFNPDAPKDPTRPYCTPRSFTYASEFIAEEADGMALPSDPITQEIVEGFIGEHAAAEFFSFIKVEGEIPSIEEVLAAPNEAKLPASDRMDAQYAAMQMCTMHATTDTIDTLFTYILRLNKELQTSAVTQLMAASTGITLNSPAIAKWTAENQALILNSIAA